MKKYLKCLKDYINAPQRYIYIEIAGNHKVDTFHVYKLAHGYEPQTPIDQEILKELKERGIKTLR